MLLLANSKRAVLSTVLSAAVLTYGGVSMFVMAMDFGNNPLTSMAATISIICGVTGPHNGAIITLLAVCGLTHRQS